jgi:putative flippase GtrA
MKKTQHIIFKILDFFYPIVNRLMPKQTYYYAACGGINTLLGLGFFVFSFHFILGKEELDLGFFAFKSHVAALILSSIFSFPTSFFLTKFIVWSESNIGFKKQLSRHAAFAILYTFMNYWMLKFLVEYLNWWPFPSQLLTIGTIVIFSYLSQKHISFKTVQ